MHDLLVTWFWRSLFFMFFLGAFLEFLNWMDLIKDRKDREKYNVQQLDDPESWKVFNDD